MTKVIERNTTIPTKKSQIFSTAADGQTQVEVNVLQGEREFARDNKQLGLFKLDGIAPAPRGIPQIEVTFDIDANGIVNVSAKDLGTGKEQHITISSSTNMSKEDIDKAVKDAEKFAADDKKKREEVDKKNEAENLCYAAEKLLKDNGDKVEEADKTDLNAKITALKAAVGSNDADSMAAKTEELQKAMYAVSEKIYKNAAPQQPAQGAEASAQDENGNPVYNAEYKDVDDDSKK
jgi:molecular chaperone DnaK